MSFVYIHIPFCQKKCLFCSFVVSIAQEHRMDEYLSCLEKEADQFRNTKIDSLYVGGGTPTYLNEKQLERLFRIIDKKFQLSGLKEATIESNPEGLTLDKLKIIKDYGFTRISLGVQSFNDKYLEYLGRCHDQRIALESFERIRKAGFDNVNLDLMFAFPGQSFDELKRDVNSIAQMGIEHLSLYNLTVEENSRFFAQKIQVPKEQIQSEFYLYIAENLPRFGLQQYEVSNFARPGFESQHNMNYWRGGNYIGLGVGAHSHHEGVRSSNTSNFFDYIREIDAGHRPNEVLEQLDGHQRLVERLLLGLRMTAGIDVNQLQSEMGIDLDATRLNLINDFVTSGFLEQEGKIIRPTLKGLPILDEMSVRLF